MKTPNYDGSQAVNHKEEQYNNSACKTRILIVDDRADRRQGLAHLIGQQADLGICVEAQNADQALEAVEAERIDLAIVDISSAKPAIIKLTEKMKLRCPNLPLLTLFMDDEVLYAERCSQRKVAAPALSQEATERIAAAIRYVQSLLRNRFYGFNVLVKVERSG